MLLPLPLPFVRDRSLVAHLALSSFQSGQGNQHLLYQLVRTTYLSYLMWSAGVGAGDYQLFYDAEREMESIASFAAEGGRWTLNESASSVLENILCLYDAQLDCISRSAFLACQAKLGKLLGMLAVRSGAALLGTDQTCKGPLDRQR